MKSLVALNTESCSFGGDHDPPAGRPLPGPPLGPINAHKWAAGGEVQTPQEDKWAAKEEYFSVNCCPPRP
jgi:hypothetical protein